MPNRPTSLPARAGRNVRLGGGAARASSASADLANEATAPGTTRERILASAERLFAERGFDNVSMPMIAAASGITAGAIYKHFDGKADLFFDVVRRVVHSVPMPTGESAADATLLPRIVGTYTTAELKQLRQLAVEIHYASINHPKVRQALRRALDRNISQISESVAALQRTGALDPTIDAQSLARALMVFVMGLMHMETLLPQLVGDAQWRGFVEDRVAALVGISESQPR